MAASQLRNLFFSSISLSLLFSLFHLDIRSSWTADLDHSSIGAHQLAAVV